MTELLKYLDETGWSDLNRWPGFPAQRMIEKEGWRYQWLIVNPRHAQLVRSRKTGGGIEIEAFLALEEGRCLYWARKLKEGIQPESPEPDPKSGMKVAFL
jgi:hypothetical protein